MAFFTSLGTEKWQAIAAVDLWLRELDSFCSCSSVTCHNYNSTEFHHEMEEKSRLCFWTT